MRTHIHPARRGFAHGTKTSLMAPCIPARCPGRATVCQVPRAPLPDPRCYRLVREVSRTSSESITPPSSLLRAHAPDLLPLLGFGSPTPMSLGRLSSVPAGRRPFPTLSLRLFPWMLGPLPRQVPRVPVPVSSPRPSAFPRSSWVGIPVIIRSATSERKAFSP